MLHFFYHSLRTDKLVNTVPTTMTVDTVTGFHIHLEVTALTNTGSIGASWPVSSQMITATDRVCVTAPVYAAAPERMDVVYGTYSVLL